MKYRVLQWLVVWGVIVGASQWSSAQTVEFWMEESNAPYSHLKENGTLDGLWFDIANEIKRDTNLQVQWRSAPWKRLFTTVKQTPNTVVFGILRTVEREDNFIFIGPITDRRIFLYKLKKRTDITLEELEDAKPYTVGGLRGAYHTEFIKTQGIRTEEVASSQTNIKKLLRGRFDLTIMEEYTFAGGIEQSGLNHNDFEKVLLLDTSHYYIALHKDTDQKVVETLQHRVKQISENGTLHRIKELYLHRNVSTP